MNTAIPLTSHLSPFTSKICRLSELKPGQSATVLNIKTKNKALRRRLFDMGITKGVKIKIKRIAPFNDPYDLLLRGYQLCLRKKDLQDIEVILEKTFIV